MDLFNCDVTSVDNYREKVFGLISCLKYLDGFDSEEKEAEDSEADEEDLNDDEDGNDIDGDSEGMPQYLNVRVIEHLTRLSVFVDQLLFDFNDYLFFY